MLTSQKYQVNTVTVNTLLTWVETDNIAIPDIQRPFVWGKTKVRNLIDSLYRGYPTGYLIAWKNPNVGLKDGTISSGKKILIDGQQRVTALTAAVLGHSVINKEYKKESIKIAFKPTTEEFEVQNPAIMKDVSWIPDISLILHGGNIIRAISEYQEKNPNADERQVQDSMQNLLDIQSKTLGLIDLEADLNIDAVCVIFERVNSAGVRLSQADFAMSKIATYGDFGSRLRKLVEYFCKLAVAPEFYPTLINTDKDFTQSSYIEKIKWLKNENDDLFDPSYSDLIRIAFTSEFERGKMGDLVSLLSGRNFETKKFEEEIQKETFERLEKSLLRVVNEDSFKKFLMIIRSTGFIVPKMIKSAYALNFAYITYLKLRERGVKQHDIGQFVGKWFVMSLLTGRYSSSNETKFDSDIKKIADDHQSYLKHIEATELSVAFWDVALVSELEKSNPSNPFLSIFFASQVKENDMGFLSTGISVMNMIGTMGDVHHIFPKAYIKKTLNSKKDYNQIANLVYTQTEINNAIKDKPPFEYFRELSEQCKGGTLKYGGITDINTLKENMHQNCIPESVFKMSIEQYHDFLKERRVLMAKKIKNYYQNL